MNSELQTFIIYVIIAVFRTVLDFFIWQIFVWMLKDSSIVTRFFRRFNLNRYALAQALAFLISAIISYFANKIYAFNNTEPDTFATILKFGIVTVAGLVASVWVIEFLTTNKSILEKIKHLKLINKYWPQIAKILTTIVTLAINFVGLRFWVF